MIIKQPLALRIYIFSMYIYIYICILQIHFFQL